MDQEDIRPFIGKEITVNTHFNDVDRFYSGWILKLTDETMLMRDKFDMLQLIRLDIIIKIGERWKGEAKPE